MWLSVKGSIDNPTVSTVLLLQLIQQALRSPCTVLDFMKTVGSFSIFQYATLNSWDGPGYQAIVLLCRLLFLHNTTRSTAWLDIILIIWLGTWNQPAWKRDAQQEYLDKHIDTAVRFNISDISDKQSSAPLMLPPPQQFEEQVGKVHIHVVCLPMAYLVHQSVYAWCTCIYYYNGPCLCCCDILFCVLLYSLCGLV